MPNGVAVGVVAASSLESFVATSSVSTLVPLVGAAAFTGVAWVACASACAPAKVSAARVSV